MTEKACPSVEYWKSQLESGVAGCLVGTIDPLESAINNTVSAAQDAEGLTLTVLQDHLKQLCEIQRKKMSSAMDEESMVGLIQDMTAKLQALTAVQGVCRVVA